MGTLNSSSEFCPYCHSNAELDFSINKRHYFHCRNCDLIFKGNRRNDDQNKVISYYEKEYFNNYAHNELTGSRNIIYSHILDTIETKINIGKLLDVGCGCGFFLKEARSRGWNVTGIDPSEKSIDYCNNTLGTASARKGTLASISTEKDYNVITMINVLDHSTEPWSEIEKSITLLKEDGLIFLRFPNGMVHPALFNIASKFRMHNLIKKYLIFHEYSFTPKFIKRLLIDCGFSKIVINNAILSGGTICNPVFKKTIGMVSNLLYYISFGEIIMSPSLEVTALKI
jgi:2-polyprenyl-3-methyl-5-hydroxy-6-metoxy-1,4-benzoquinol methylase